MGSPFDTLRSEADQHRYAAPLQNLRVLATTAVTPSDLILAARVADTAMQPGLHLRLLRRAVRMEGCPAEGLLRLGATYLEDDRYLEAEELLTPHLEREDWSIAERAEGRAQLGIAYAGRRRFTSAWQALDQATAMVAGAGAEAEREIAYLRIVLLAYQDRWEEAIAELKPYMAGEGAEPRAYQLLATCQEHLGRPDEVFATLQEACERFPEQPQLWHRLAVAAWSLERPEVGRQALDRAAALIPYPRATRRFINMREMMEYQGTALPVPPLRQGHNHCFPACLAMVCAYYGRAADQRAIGSAVMDGESGTSLYRALRYLEEQGWACRAFRATPERVKQLIDQGVPTIMGLEWADGAHVHVVIGYDEERLLIQDPAHFYRRRLRLTYFNDAYAHSDFWALAFTPADKAAALEPLPADDDRVIRQVQRCWEHLRAERLDEARQVYDQLLAEPITPALQFMRLRTWPRLGQKEDALAAAEGLLESFADHGQIRLEVARHLARLDREERAVAIVKEWSGRLPHQALMILGRAARRHSLEEACRLFRKAAIADPHDPYTIATWGEVESRAGNLEKAEALFTAAMEMDPAPTFRADLANLRTQQGRPAEAVVGFRKVLKEQRLYPWSWWRRAEAHWELGQMRAAARCLRIAAAQDPEMTVPVDRLADLYAETGQPQRAIRLLQESPLLPKDDDLQHSLAILLLNQEQCEEALKVTEAAMAQFPADARFGPVAAEALRRLDRVDEGKALLTRLTEEQPDSAYLQGRFSRYLLLMGETEEGIRRLDQARELDPEWDAPLDWAQAAVSSIEKPQYLLAYLARQAEEAKQPIRLLDLAQEWLPHDRKRALACGEAAMQIAGEHAQVVARYGHLLLECGDTAGAISALRKALKADRSLTWAWATRARAHSGRGERRAALRCLRIATAQEPDEPRWLDRLSDAYEELGQRDRAIALLEASPLLPTSDDLQLSLAVLLLNDDQFDQALSLAEQATAQFPSDMRFGPLAADALRLSDRTDQGEALLRQMAEEHPDEAYLAGRLGRYLLLTGKLEEGLVETERALDLDPDWEAPLEWAERAAAQMDQPEPVLTFLVAQAEKRGEPRRLWDLADLWLEREPQRAMACARLACKLDGDTPGALVEFGFVALKAEEYEEARRSFLGALSIAPTARAYYGLARLAQAEEETGDRRHWLEKAVEAAEEPEDLRRYADELGDVLEEEQQVDEIRSLMERLRGRVDEAWRLTYLGYAAELQHRHDEAVALYRSALEVEPHLRWTYYRMPQVLLELGQHQEALTMAQEGARRWSQDAGFHWLVGRCCAAMGDIGQAVEHYRTGVKTNPNWVPARYALWEVMSKAGIAAYRAQIADLDRPQQALLLWYAGENWRKADDRVNAVAAWRASAELDPTDADPHIRLAEVALESENQAEAWSEVEQVLALRPGAFEFTRDVLEKTDKELAVQVLPRAIARIGDEHREERADLHYLLGNAHGQLDRTDEAVASWRQAIADLPLHRGAASRLAIHHAQRMEWEQVMALLTPLDEADRLVDNLKWLVVCYVWAAVVLNRPRRPHWRNLVVKRLEGALAELAEVKKAEDEADDEDEGAKESRKQERKQLESEIERLRELYDRLEVEFGNLRAARNSWRHKDSSTQRLRVLILWLKNLVRRAPLDIRPGESKAPVTDGPIGGPGWFSRYYMLLLFALGVLGQRPILIAPLVISLLLCLFRMVRTNR